MLILVKIFKNLDFRQNFRFSQTFRKISILVTLFGELDWGQNIRKISIFGKILENLDFGEHLQKSRF